MSAAASALLPQQFDDPGMKASIIGTSLVMVLVGVLLLVVKEQYRRWLWLPTPLLGIAAIVLADLGTKDATAGGQVFLCAPVLFAASQLRAKVAKTGDGGTALILLDVDRFKTINDTWGHPVGDAALTHLADVLRSRCRPDIVISRLGGDELALSISVGVAHAPSHADDLRDLYAAADASLYDAKRNGRGRVGSEPLTPDRGVAAL